MIEWLADIQFPVAVTGTLQNENEFVIQVDTDNERASEDLTNYLISKGYRHFASIRLINSATMAFVRHSIRRAFHMSGVHWNLVLRNMALFRISCVS